jgi:hypothetical protein
MRSAYPTVWRLLPTLSHDLAPDHCPITILTSPRQRTWPTARPRSHPSRQRPRDRRENDTPGTTLPASSEHSQASRLSTATFRHPFMHDQPHPTSQKASTFSPRAPARNHEVQSPAQPGFKDQDGQRPAHSDQGTKPSRRARPLPSRPGERPPKSAPSYQPAAT